jgi:HD superfamily phosphohydrolase
MQIFDSLYGNIDFLEDIERLIHTPAIQRLRFIRLSNIDSFDMPGISNISRFEHVLGTCHLASSVGFSAKLDPCNRLALMAAALLHDAAIAPFGHLIEEALLYLNCHIEHETKWQVLREAGEHELGGLNLQVFKRRESGIGYWAERVFAGRANQYLATITEAIAGRGELGSCIAGCVDLDNLDNVVRVAYHMGINVDRRIAIQAAEHMVEIKDANIIFSSRAIDSLSKWLDLRNHVYTKLMLSRNDFSAKIMLLQMAVSAFEKGYLGEKESVWKLTDDEFINRLFASNDKDIIEYADDWSLQRFWPLTDLFWMSGVHPGFPKLHQFSLHLTKLLKRKCFAYGIKDKRTRIITIHFSNGSSATLGKQPTTWLLGVAAVRGDLFKHYDNEKIRSAAEEYFSCSVESSDAKQSDFSLFPLK